MNVEQPETLAMIESRVYESNGFAIARLRLAWQDECFIPLASKATITELIRVIAYPKFKLKITEQEDLLADYLLCLADSFVCLIVPVEAFFRKIKY